MSRPAEVGADTRAGGSSPARHLLGTGPRVFLLAFVVFFGGGAIWSAATPLLAAPDEPSQIIKAASVAHGVWTARCYITPEKVPPGNCTQNAIYARGFEALPTFYDLIIAPVGPGVTDSQTCFKSKVDGLGANPAACARSLNRPPSKADIIGGYAKYSSSYQARYPPLYYFVVGLPSHFGDSTIDLYLMRLFSAAFSAIFLAIALTAAVRYSRNRMLPVGLVGAVTPMVLFLAGVVNPSGLEVAAATAVWVTGGILVTEHLAAPPRGLVALLGGSAVVLESVRALSPLWLVATVVFLVACAERHALLRALRRRSLVGTTGVVALFGAVAVWWTLAVHATDLYLGGNVPVPRSVSTVSIFFTALGRNRFYFPDMVGIFGWFDTYSPAYTFIVWYVLVGALVVAAAVRSVRRALILGGLSLVVVVLPAVIITSHAHTDGYTWSGRDILPLAVGLPVLGATMLGLPGDGIGRVIRRRITLGVIVLAATAHFVAFYEALRRYAVGTHGPIFGFITHPSWHPAIGIVGALLCEIAAIGALSLLFGWAALGNRAPGGDPGVALDTPSTGTPAHSIPVPASDG